MPSGYLNSPENIFFLLIKLLCIIVVLYVAYLIIRVLVTIIFGWLGKVKKGTIDLLSGLLLFLCILFLNFHLIVGTAYFLCPHSLYIDLIPRTHDSEIDFSFVAIEGTYTDTETGYVMKANPYFPLPVATKIIMKRIDENHISINGMDFLTTEYIRKTPSYDSGKKKGGLPVYNGTKIIRCVPDSEVAINFSSYTTYNFTNLSRLEV